MSAAIRLRRRSVKTCKSWTDKLRFAYMSPLALKFEEEESSLGIGSSECVGTGHDAICKLGRAMRAELLRYIRRCSMLNLRLPTTVLSSSCDSFSARARASALRRQLRAFDRMCSSEEESPALVAPQCTTFRSSSSSWPIAGERLSEVASRDAHWRPRAGRLPLVHRRRLRDMRPLGHRGSLRSVPGGLHLEGLWLAAIVVVLCVDRSHFAILAADGPYSHNVAKGERALRPAR